MARSGKPISVIAAELPHYEIVKTKVEIGSDRLTKALDALATHWPDAAVNRLDGLRLDWPDRWLHVRPSNTEPIVRAIAEGPTRTVAEQLCEVAKRIIAG
jgi:phosphomannomutase